MFFVLQRFQFIILLIFHLFFEQINNKNKQTSYFHQIFLSCTKRGILAPGWWWWRNMGQQIGREGVVESFEMYDEVV